MQNYKSETKYGIFEVNVKTKIVVNGELEWSMKFIPTKDIEPGASIKIIVPAYQHQRSEEYLQTYDYWKPNFIYAIGENDNIDVDVSVEKIDSEFKHIKGWLDSSRVALVKLDSGLKKDEAISIKFGGIDRPWIDGIAPPSRVSQFANRVEDKTLDYEVYIDCNGNQDYKQIDVFPKIEVIPDKPKKIILTSPSVVRKDEEFSISAMYVDRYLNPILDANLDNLYITLENLKTNEKVKVAYKDGFKASIDNDGFYNITIEDTDLEVLDTVTLCSNDLSKLYWGDTHIHSNLTANIRDNDYKATPRQGYLYAKEISKLDFIGLSEQTFQFDDDNGLNIDRKTWNQMGIESDKYYKPGELVTFTGFELHDKRGDTVVLFKDSLSKYPYPENISKIQEVWDFYKGESFLSIPHLHRYCNGRRTLDQQDIKHGGFQLSNWEDNPKEERLCEVFSSQWGRFENQNHPMILKARNNVEGNTVSEFLNRGKKWGIVANSDGHDGNPGYGGVTGVFATEKTRDSIFSGLENRRTIATTHPRVVLSYKINGFEFGQEVESDNSSSRKIDIVALSPIKIKTLDIIKNGKVYKTIDINSKYIQKEIIDDNLEQEETYYYIRLMLDNGHIAWASPIWFKN